MLNWLLYTMLVGGLLTLAAHCVTKVCHLVARPTRWVWVSALTLTVALAGVAPYRAMVLSRAQSTQRATIPTGSDMRQQAPSSTGRLLESVQFVRREMTTPTITIPTQRVPVSLDAYLAVAWGTLSVVVLLFFGTVYLRFLRARHGWPISELHGVRIRIAPDGGPVVLGLRHPEIVIPQWLLGRSAEEQRVVLTHEQEHIRAGDPWVLAVACVIAALLPWHPLVWWMVSRLRLAIELDCDTRVLRQGVAPQTYGSLLIDLAGRCSGLPVRALALADNRSHLKQRLLAMKSLRPRFATVQGAFFGSSTLFLLVTAGIAQVPLHVEHQEGKPQLTYSTENNHVNKLKQTAMAASAAAGVLAHTPTIHQAQNQSPKDSLARHTVAVQPDTQVRPLMPSKVDTDSVVLNSTEYLSTREGDGWYRQTEIKKWRRSTYPNGSCVDSKLDTTYDFPRIKVEDTVASYATATMGSGAKKLLVLDGVPFTNQSAEDAMKRIDQDDIEQIEYVMGAMAVRRYGVNADGFVAVMTTRKTKHYGHPCKDSGTDSKP